MPTRRRKNRDHAKRQQRPMPEDGVIAAQIEALVTPALFAQESYYRRWHRRQKRPLPESVEYTKTKFAKIWICDGSTLEAIFKKLDSLANVPIGQLAGKMGVVIDLVTRIPVDVWFEENAKASDVKFESNILNLVTAETLLLLDRGFYHFHFWQQLIERKIQIITRLKQGASFSVKQVFSDSCCR